MEYSVRHRRRLRPTTGERADAVAVAVRAVAAPRTGQLAQGSGPIAQSSDLIAQGSGPVATRNERPLVTELIAPRTYARVRATSAKR